jgi:hypothetical protein
MLNNGFKSALDYNKRDGRSHKAGIRMTIKNPGHCFRSLTHPIGLGLVTAISIILWVPFGYGYYGWAWEKPVARAAMQTFVFFIPLYAVVGCAAAISPRFCRGRLTGALFALLAGLYGVMSMSYWLSVYVAPHFGE